MYIALGAWRYTNAWSTSVAWLNIDSVLNRCPRRWFMSTLYQLWFNARWFRADTTPCISHWAHGGVSTLNQRGSKFIQRCVYLTAWAHARWSINAESTSLALIQLLYYAWDLCLHVSIVPGVLTMSNYMIRIHLVQVYSWFTCLLISLIDCWVYSNETSAPQNSESLIACCFKAGSALQTVAKQ